MVSFSRLLLVPAVVASTAAVGESSVENVVKLLTDLKAEVEGEGKKETETYDKYKTFCTETTGTKDEAIKTNTLNAETSTAAIESKNSELADKVAEIKRRKEAAVTLDTEKTDSARQCAEDKVAYDASEVDLSAAIKGLEGAVEKLKAADGGAFLQLEKPVKSAIEQGLKLAEALGVIQANKKATLASFLQGDPWTHKAGSEHNKEEYKFQSSTIVQTLEGLLTDFKEQKKTADDEWAKTDKACKDTAAAKTTAIENNAEALATAKEDEATLEGEVAEEKATLLETQKTLKEDQAILAEVKENCAARASDFEQRSKNRADEVEALTSAIGDLSGKAAEADAAIKGEFFMQVKSSYKAISPAFIQTGSSRKVTLRSAGKSASAASAQMMARAMSAARFLSNSGHRLHSARIAGIAVQLLKLHGPQIGAEAGNDSLKMVKRMVTDLVAQLTKEAAEDAEKRGACETQMIKAKKERQRRQTESDKINAKLKSLESKRTRLEDENSVLADELNKLREDLNKATTLRTEQSTENANTVTTAKEGISAVKTALQTLRAFYKKAAHLANNHNKAAALFLEIKKDAPDAGFEGGYAGKQSQATGIIALIENVQGDFEKTVKDTKVSEDAAREAFTELKKGMNADIGEKETNVNLNQEEIKETEDKLRSGKTNLANTMNLLDTALQTLEDLKPTCINEGESYAEKKASRQQQIDDLQKAMCMLEPDNAACKVKN
eukprot:TRINITY_DN41872_c0_g1_i1.p1 TRINITY_DN41872_c0_g1~~TRINITY_DN41872_c0_g1_i1.p1  ORF type:complete len:725 (+),score=211.89 TRINITY_DN41872_c0_g1_i1:101-2275(+)